MKEDTLSAQSIDRELIREGIVVETLRSRGLAVDGLARRILEPITKPALETFIDLIAATDAETAQISFQSGCATLARRFMRSVEVLGLEKVPLEGPLLLLANHPGAFDELVVAALVKRKDLRFFANDHPILTSFPHVSNHAVYSGNSDSQKMAALRHAIRHLRDGGTLLLCPAGKTEPDPRYTPGAFEAFADWSPSVEVLARKNDALRIVVVQISNAVSGRMVRSPLFAFRPTPLERQKFATSVQVALQFGFPWMFNLVPRITFSAPVTVAELTAGGASVHEAVIARARQMLPLHEPGAPAAPLLRL